MFFEERALPNDAKPVGLLTEGAAGNRRHSPFDHRSRRHGDGALASIVTIVIGVGLMVQAFNSAAELSKATAANTVAMPDLGGDVMVDLVCGITGVLLGILALVGINPQHLVPSALIVLGGAAPRGAISMRPRSTHRAAAGGETQLGNFGRDRPNRDAVDYQRDL